MVGHVKIEKETMFQKAVDAGKNRLNQGCDKIEEEMEELVQSKVNLLTRDHRSKDMKEDHRNKHKEDHRNKHKKEEEDFYAAVEKALKEAEARFGEVAINEAVVKREVRHP